MAEQKDEITRLLIDLKLEDNTSEAAQKSRAAMRKYRDDLDDLLGRVAKGDAQFSAWKAELEKIRDPTLRAAQAQKLLNRQHNQQLGLLDKLVDRGKAFQVDLASQGAMGTVAAGGLLAAAAAVTALGAAFTAFASDSAQKYLEANWQTIQATADLTASYDALKVSFGGALLGPPDEAAAQINGLTRVLQNLDKEVQANTKEINDFVKKGIDALDIALTVLTATTAAAMTPGALLIDGLLNLGGVAAGVAGNIVNDLGGAMSALGLVTEETAEEISNFGIALNKTGVEMGETNWTGTIWDSRDAMLEFTGSVLDGEMGVESLTTDVSALDMEMVELKGTLEELAQMDALAFLGAVADAPVGPLAEGGGTDKPKKTTKPKRRGGGGRPAAPELTTEEEFFAGGFAGGLEEDAMVAELEAIERLKQYKQELGDVASPAAAALADAAAQLKGLDEALSKAFEEQAERTAMIDDGVNALSASFLDLAGSIVAGEVALSSFASAGLKMVGGVFYDYGKAMVLASIAQKGLMSLNPILTGFGGAGMMAIGALMKRGGSAMEDAGGGGASASVGAGSTLESVGRQFTEQTERDREGGDTYIQIGPREIRDFVKSTTADAMRRGEFGLARSI